MKTYPFRRNISLDCVVRPTPNTNLDNRVRMVRLDTTEQIVKYDRATMPIIHANVVDAVDRAYIGQMEMRPSEASQIYFVASTKYAGYHYILTWYEARRAYKCSCLEGKKHGYCVEQRKLEDHLGIA